MEEGERIGEKEGVEEEERMQEKKERVEEDETG